MYAELPNGDYRIPSPPEQTYEYEKALTRETRAWCKLQGIDLIRSSLQDWRRRHIRCERGELIKNIR